MTRPDMFIPDILVDDNEATNGYDGEVSEIPCAPGKYCRQGMKHNCPAGSYGRRKGLKDDMCDGACLPGFYCKEPSTSNTQNACGDRRYYCPHGASNPIQVTSGYFSYNSSLEYTSSHQYGHPSFDFGVTMSWQKECDEGHYCKDGVRYECPAGTYGNRVGMKSKDECLSCRRG